MTAQERFREKHEVRKSLEKYVGIEGIDYVECKICNKRSLYIDKRHLKTRHRLTKEDYCKLFPEAILTSRNKIDVQRNNAIGNTANLGKKFSKEHCKKISKAQIGKYVASPSKETIEKAKKTRETTLLRKYNVTNACIYMILNGKRWGSVT